MEENEFAEDLKIDLENLEVETALQSELYFKWAKIVREAREAWDTAKLNLDVTESKLSRMIREKPGSFGVTKITEGSIKEAVKVHPNYEEAFKKCSKARGEHDLLLDAKEALRQRSKKLSDLIELYLGEYFAGPNSPHTPDEYWEKVKEKRGVKTNEKMVKRTRKVIKRKS